MIVSLEKLDKDSPNSAIRGNTEGCGCCSSTYYDEDVEIELIYNLDIIKEYCNMADKNFDEFLEQLKTKL
jgi:hypothetical protein